LPAFAGVEDHIAYIRQVVERQHTIDAIQITPADAHIAALGISRTRAVGERRAVVVDPLIAQPRDLLPARETIDELVLPQRCVAAELAVHAGDRC
jgi:hypothetical protein